MYTGINLHSSVPTRKEESAVDMLLACHQRIRHFVSVARKIAEAEDVPCDQICDAAADVHRYFTVAFPLHEADETLSVEPRLDYEGDTRLANASREMLRQHFEINTLLRQLLPLWDALCREPEELPDFADRLRKLSTEFETLWLSHLKLEEDSVIPAIHQLTSEQREQILQEMRERRRPMENVA